MAESIMYNENDRIYPNGEPNNNSAADKNENINTESEMSASGSQTESFSNEPEKSGSYSDMQNDEKANYNQNFNNSTPQYANGSPWQHPYGVNQQNNQNSAPAWNGNEYSYKPQTQPYNVHTASNENQNIQNYSTAQNQYIPYQPDTAKRRGSKKQRRGGMSKGGIAALIAVCIVFSGAAGIGGSIAANRYFKDNTEANTNTNSNASVIYQDVNSKKNLGETNYSVANVVQAVSDTVVEIVTEQVSTNSIFGQYISKGAGSGVILTEDGYIVTCAHVIEGATTVKVTLTDGTSYDATVIGSDTQTDIALIKIEATGLTSAVIGDSDTLVVGEPAIAIGNPLGELGGTTTSGIISALEREVTIDGTTYKLLQTNAAINPGNSGGALFDSNGNLIGIVNAKESGTAIEGLGFAIPINDAMEVVEQLRSNGYVSGRPAFGIYVYDVSDDTALYGLKNSDYKGLLNYVNNYGVYFLKYTDGQTGDLQFGDRIVAIDGITVSSQADLKSLLSEYKIGDTATVTVSRISDSQTGRSNMLDVTITLIEAAANK
ncbi:MAG: trypsin-like peptidase domain-containing protein [Clostridia bacterium]|nr:trypsin-like peptidase domain-containing protein [Clostridia bacterium]